ncbi:MAG: cytochrome c oxidase subunit II [Rhodospirillales bacterium]
MVAETGPVERLSKRRNGGDMQNRKLTRSVVTGTALGLSGLPLVSGLARADALGQAKPWEIYMQPAFSPVAEQIHQLHGMLMAIITAIVVLVLGVLAYVMFRFSAKRNPVPSRTTHNTLLEVVWTAIPILILVIIAIPSLRLLFFQDAAPSTDMTLKVTGRQWYWHYSYPDHGDFAFDSIPIPDSDLTPGQPRLLTVDNPVVVPVGATVKVQMTSDDVIHNWAIPSLGLKKDTTPGRLNETWFRANAEGVFYGMCSELCGVNHYFMPIQVIAVSREKFDAWVAEAQKKFASAGSSDLRLAENTGTVR